MCIRDRWWDGTNRIAEKQWERQKRTKVASLPIGESNDVVEKKEPAKEYKFINYQDGMIMLDSDQIKSDEDMQEALREFNEAVRKKQKDK